MEKSEIYCEHCKHNKPFSSEHFYLTVEDESTILRKYEFICNCSTILGLQNNFMKTN